MTSSLSPLLKNELFTLDHQGVYHVDNAPKETLAYSDGDENQQSVRNIIQAAEDLSSASQELDRSWEGWPQEAHLSAKRQNLLAAMDWKAGSKVLEIGCGCGALTRYLGEQNLYVDALELSAERATITRERCRDLATVNVFCANVNDIEIPLESYDAILLVGVVEYTARFSEQSEPVESLVEAMLSRLLASLTPKGIIFIAIENRLGFKYLMGASEDHYGVPGIGLSRYPDYGGDLNQRKQGIYTFDYDQWQRLLERLTNIQHKFFFPFPDYKLPEVVLGEDFVRNDPYCHQILYRLRSRDYCSNWAPPLNEYSYWQATAQTGQLHKTANSFGIILGKDKASVAASMPYDFVRFANLKRKSFYCIQTAKLQQISEVTKTLEFESNPNSYSQQLVVHSPQAAPYIYGKLLNDIWVEAFTTLGDACVVSRFLKDYYQFLVQHSKQDTLSAGDLDLIVFNLIVDEEGNWQPIDVEWQWQGEPRLTANFVLFRCLMYFAYVHGDSLLPCFNGRAITSVRDFVEFGFSTVGVSKVDFLTFQTMEDEFQSTVLNDWAFQTTQCILEQPLNSHTRALSPEISIDFFWASPKHSFNAEQSMSELMRVQPGLKKITFDLPEEISAKQNLRIDPVNHQLTDGFRRLSIEQITITGERGQLQLETWAQILQSADVTGMHAIQETKRDWLIASNDPQIIFSAKTLSTLGQLKSVSLTLRWPDELFSCTQERRLQLENEAMRQALLNQVN